MAALAYTLGKREINYYFSVRSAKALALGAVLLLTACHAASRRYRGEGVAAGTGHPFLVGKKWSMFLCLNQKVLSEDSWLQFCCRTTGVIVSQRS
uniref:Uncharacterized protein n=1 Tax=Anser cygnoides TaxID=8845 RepID=A0A8B9EWP9_ANSCY